MEQKDSVVQNINYANKTKSVSAPNVSLGSDVDHAFYSNIIGAAEKGELDINVLNSFTNISRSRDHVYSLLDMMSEDSIIASALEIYASDACEPNEEGKIIWAESDDPQVLAVAAMCLENMNADKNSYGWLTSLIKYGDLYLRLYRKSETENDTNRFRQIKEKDTLNEDVNFKAYSKNDGYSGYVDAEKNPANMFDLVKHGKTYGFLKTHVDATDISTGADPLEQFKTTNFLTFNRNDVDVYEATEYVHATLDDKTNRTSEEISLINTNENGEEYSNTYDVKRGKSVLYDSFKIWRELTLLENSVLLNRLTRSSIVRTIGVEVGDMEKNSVRDLLSKIKGMIEQKSAISIGNSIREYTNPGPMENVIYFPTHDGKGNITPSQIGGDAGVSENSLGDLDYWKKKLYASLGIPGQFLGDTADSTGFNGGSSLSLISSRYAKTIKRIQNAYCQAIETAINLMMYDMGLIDYIGKFIIRMQAPTTQEEKDRKDNYATSINNADSLLRIVDDHIEDPIAKLKIFKNVLSSVTNDQDILQTIQEQIESLESEKTSRDSDEEVDEGDIFSEDDVDIEGDQITDSEELPSIGETNSEPFELEEPNENFYTNEGGELLNENSLPSFSELGMSYTDVQ